MSFLRLEFVLSPFESPKLLVSLYVADVWAVAWIWSSFNKNLWPRAIEIALSRHRRWSLGFDWDSFSYANEENLKDLSVQEEFSKNKREGSSYHHLKLIRICKSSSPFIRAYEQESICFAIIIFLRFEKKDGATLLCSLCFRSTRHLYIYIELDNHVEGSC